MNRPKQVRRPTARSSLTETPGIAADVLPEHVLLRLLQDGTTSAGGSPEAGQALELAAAIAAARALASDDDAPAGRDLTMTDEQLPPIEASTEQDEPQADAAADVGSVATAESEEDNRDAPTSAAEEQPVAPAEADATDSLDESEDPVPTAEVGDADTDAQPAVEFEPEVAAEPTVHPESATEPLADWPAVDAIANQAPEALADGAAEKAIEEFVEHVAEQFSEVDQMDVPPDLVPEPEDALPESIEQPERSEAPDQQPEPALEPEPSAAAAPDAGADATPVVEAEPGAAAEPELEAAIAELEPQQEPEPSAAAEPEVGADAAPVVEAEPELEAANAELEPQQEPEPDLEAAGNPAEGPATTKAPEEFALTSSTMDRVQSFLGELRGALVEIAQRPQTTSVDVDPLIQAMQSGFDRSAEEATRTSTALASLGEQFSKFGDRVEDGLSKTAEATRTQHAPSPAMPTAASAAAPPFLDNQPSRMPLVLGAVTTLVFGWAILFWVKTGSPRLALGTLIAGNAIACCLLLARRDRS